MIKFKNIKNIIFDIGEVLLTVNKLAAHDALVKLGIDSGNLAEMLVNESGDYFKYEQGLIDSSEFRAFFRKKSSAIFSDDEFDRAWGSMLDNFPKDRIEILQVLSKKIKVFILSNTNEIHINTFNKMLQNDFGINNLSQIVEKAYYSNEIKLRKPNPKIYEYVLADSKLQAENTLFIDDRLENLVAAEKYGIKTYLFTGKESFTELFNEFM